MTSRSSATLQSLKTARLCTLAGQQASKTMCQNLEGDFSAILMHLDAAIASLSESAPLQGTWPANDLRRIFVEGMKWWEFKGYGATAFPSDVRQAEAEAERRYGNEESSK